MHLFWFFFFLFPLPPFFSVTHVKCRINKRCPGWCFLSWCSRASPCPAGAAFHISPLRDQIPPPLPKYSGTLPTSHLPACLCPLPGWQHPTGVCRLPVPALPCGWGTRSLSLGVKPDPLLLACLCGPFLSIRGRLVIKKPWRGILLS